MRGTHPGTFLCGGIFNNCFLGLNSSRIRLSESHPHVSEIFQQLAERKFCGAFCPILRLIRSRSPPPYNIMKKSLLCSLPLLLLSPFFLSAQSPSPTPAPTTVEKVYLPYDKLEEIFDKEGQGVFLPYREFIDMWNKVNMAEVIKKSEPPVDGILASAHYTGKVSGEVVTIDAKLNFESLKEGWSALSL